VASKFRVSISQLYPFIWLPPYRVGPSRGSVIWGKTATGILNDFAKAFGDKMEANVMHAGRPDHAEEVARVIAFLLSDVAVDREHLKRREFRLLRKTSLSFFRR